MKEFIEQFVQIAKGRIIQLAKTNFTNEEKKNLLDEQIIEFIETQISVLPLNFIQRWIIKKVIIENVSVITQCIFNLLKEKIESL